MNPCYQTKIKLRVFKRLQKEYQGSALLDYGQQCVMESDIAAIPVGDGNWRSPPHADLLFCIKRAGFNVTNVHYADDGEKYVVEIPYASPFEIFMVSEPICTMVMQTALEYGFEAGLNYARKGTFD